MSGDREQLGYRRGENHPRTYFTREEVDHMRDLYEDHGVSISEIARLYGIPRSTVRDVVHYYTWPP